MPDTQPPAPAAPDPVAAELSWLHSRHYRIPDPGGQPDGICQSDRHKWPCHAHRALSALKAVLKAADEAEPVERDYGGEPIWWSLTPAEVREAITREITGTGGGNA